MMAIESPISVGIISRLPDPKINTAAFLILMSLALWIESPVIDLLATSTTLSARRANFPVLRRFAIWTLLLASGVHALVSLTPLYDLVTLRILGLQPAVAEAARWPMVVMIPWSAFIGWRRYLQGILIRFHQTRLVGIGTALRVSTMAGVGLLLFVFAPLDGVMIAAIALVASVFIEAVFVHIVSARVMRRELAEPVADDGEPPISMGRLVRFHTPLTITTLLLLSAIPIVSAALARAPDAVLAMAGWQVSLTLMWLLRTVVFALPEVVITLYRDRESARVLRAFCVKVGAVCSAVLILVAVSGLDRWFFTRVLDAQPSVAEVAHIALLGGALLPFIGALQSYVRGMLTAHHLTASRLAAVGVGLVTLVGSLVVGVALGLSGVVNAAIAMTVSLAAELWVLVVAWRRAPGRHVLAASNEPPQGSNGTHART